MSDDFNEFHFIQALYYVEGAILLAMEVTSKPPASVQRLQTVPE